MYGICIVVLTEVLGAAVELPSASRQASLTPWVLLYHVPATALTKLRDGLRAALEQTYSATLHQ